MEQAADGGRSERGADRANVLLAVALVLAALVVLAAASLTLAPTGSDGVTDESTLATDFDVVEEGLGVVFTESNDTLDPGYQPSFDEPEHEGTAPIDYDTVEALLASEPFTREQVVQTKSLMASLANRRTRGTIASLEPVSNLTRTGTLVRLGNDGAHDFGGTETTLVENATAVQDLELVFERETLPFTAGNATTVRVGDWTLAAHQDVGTGRVSYQLGEHDPGGDWRQTAAGSDLRVSVHEGTVNGVPVEDGALGIDPGEPPFDVTVADTRRAGTPPEFPGTHGGVNLVAVGTGADDIGDISATDWQTVVSDTGLDVTYVDATTTAVERVDVDPSYTYFGYEGSDAERDPRVGIDTTVETVAFGGQEGVFVNDTDGAALTTEVKYWNGTTAEVTDQTAYEIPDAYEGTATVSEDGDGPQFVPLLYLPDDAHEVNATHEIAAGGETHTFEETLPVNVINPIAGITVDIETASVGSSQGIMPVVGDEYAVAVTGEFIDGRERAVTSREDIALDIEGNEYVEVDGEGEMTLSPVTTTPDDDPVEVEASFLPTPAYESPDTDPLVAGSDTAPVVDPVQDISLDIDAETRQLPLAVDSYVLTGGSYTVETTANLVNGSAVEVQGSEWVDQSFEPPHDSDPPATLNETATGTTLEPEAVTDPGSPLTVEASYTFDSGVSDSDTVAVLELEPTGLSVDIQSEQLTINGTANVSVELAYDAAGSWPDGVAVEQPPGAIESCETTYVIVAACGATPYQVTGHFHGQGTLNVTVDESEVFDITGGQFTDGDQVAVGLVGTHLPFTSLIPPHRARLDVAEMTDETANPNGSLRAQSAEFELTADDINIEEPFGWLDEGIEIHNNATANVLSDRPTQVRAMANLQAADEYDLGNRSIPPYLTGDFSGPEVTCGQGCWELTDVSFEGGEFDETEPFRGPEYRTEGFTPREEGQFDVEADVTYLEVPQEIQEKYEQAGMGDIAPNGTMDVPVLGDIQYNVTLSEEALYEQGEGSFISTEAIVNQDDGKITVNTVLKNEGEQTGLFDVEFEILDSELQTKETVGIELEPDESVGLSKEFDELPPPGNYETEVNIRDGNVTDSSTFEIVAQEPEPELSNLDIAGQGENATIEVGQNESVSIDIKNIGSSSGSFDIELKIVGQISNDKETDVIGVGETKTIIFNGITSTLEPIEQGYSIKLSADGGGSDSVSGTIVVSPPEDCPNNPCPI